VAALPAVRWAETVVLDGADVPVTDGFPVTASFFEPAFLPAADLLPAGFPSAALLAAFLTSAFLASVFLAGLSVVSFSAAAGFFAPFFFGLSSDGGRGVTGGASSGG
jgi:hypothetical protein